jgi:hypothetical protein
MEVVKLFLTRLHLLILVEPLKTQLILTDQYTVEIDPNIPDQVVNLCKETMTHKLPDMEVERLLDSQLHPLIPERRPILMDQSTLETDPNTLAQVDNSCKETMTHKLLVTVVERPLDSLLHPLILERRPILMDQSTPEIDLNTQDQVDNSCRDQLINLLLSHTV